MIQIGIRLHDVNSRESADRQTLEARAAKAREEGFSNVHLALSTYFIFVKLASRAFL